MLSQTGLIATQCCSNHSSLRTNDLTHSKALSRLSSKEWGTYKRTRQGALAAFVLYLYTWLLVRATTISNRPLSPCFILMLITHPHVFTIRPPCFLHVPSIVLHHLSSSPSYMCAPCVHHEEPSSLDVISYSYLF